MAFILDNIDLLIQKKGYIPQLKKLILKLAVQGKLVEQDSNDEPATNHLETHFLKIKERYKKEKGAKPVTIKKSTNFKELVTEDDSIPDGWAKIYFVNFCTLQRGFDLPRRNRKEGEYVIASSGGIIGTHNECKRKAPGVVTGRSGSVGKVHYVMNDFWPLNTTLFVSDFNNNLEEYVYFFLKSFDLSRFSTSTAVPTLDRKKFFYEYVLVPPLNEQKRIVQKVNTLFQQLDELAKQVEQSNQCKGLLTKSLLHELQKASDAQTIQKAWGQVQTHFDTIFDEVAAIKELRKTILQLAVQGKLVEQDPNDEPASELLKKIAKEKEQLVKEKKIKKPKKLPAISKEEIPSESPDSWVWCRLGEIGILERGKSKHRPRNDSKLFSNGKYPLVQTGDVSKAKFNQGEIRTHTSMYNDFGLTQSKLWEKGTLCITIAANIAECGFLAYKACFPDSVVGFYSLVEKTVTNYVYLLVQGLKDYLEIVAPSTAQKNINLGILNNLLICFPPLNEQKRIVQRVNQLMSICDQLEKELSQRQAVQAKMVKSVVQNIMN